MSKLSNTKSEEAVKETAQTDAERVATSAEATAEVKQETKTAKPAQAESEYTTEEFANNAKSLFNTRKECVVAALRAASVTKTTVFNAKRIVDEFLKKEVK